MYCPCIFYIVISEAVVVSGICFILIDSGDLACKSVLLQGVELGVVDVPLHRIDQKSVILSTKPVIVGIGHALPSECVLVRYMA